MAAPDFYFAINATFRYIHEKFGEAALIGYWEAMGDEYFHYLSEHFRTGGLEAVAAYWEQFFEAEPGADVTVQREGNQVQVEVKVCPAIRHLRLHGREIMPLYCDHCKYVTAVIARKAGMSFELHGRGGSCLQCFTAASPVTNDNRKIASQARQREKK